MNIFKSHKYLISFTGADNKRKFHLNLQNRKNEENGNAISKTGKTKTLGGGGEMFKQFILMSILLFIFISRCTYLPTFSSFPSPPPSYPFCLSSPTLSPSSLF
jgi:hypothetical protein